MVKYVWVHCRFLSLNVYNSPHLNKQATLILLDYFLWNDQLTNSMQYVI